MIRKSRVHTAKLPLSSRSRLQAFRQIPVNMQGAVLLSLSKHAQKTLLKKLTNDEVMQFLHYLDPGKTTDVVQQLRKRREGKITKKLGQDIREKVEFLMRFDPRTAAGLMSIDYVEVEQTDTFRKVSDLIRKHERATGKFPAILVMNNGFLIGEIPGREVVIRKKSENVKRYVKRIPSLMYDHKEQDVLKIFQKNIHNKIVVLDNDNSIMGVIYADDILHVMHRRQGKNLADFAGVQDEEDVLDGATMKVKYRYKWLFVNLLTAFMAAFVVGVFQDTISSLILLAVYMPIVAGMGGNAATQTLAVTVRGIALKEVELKTAKRIVGREMLTGGINGFFIGLIVTVIAAIFNMNLLLGLVAGLAILLNLVVAGFFGSVVPLLMHAVGKDPATSATVFITTATDMLGFFMFLGLATLVL